MNMGFRQLAVCDNASVTFYRRGRHGLTRELVQPLASLREPGFLEYLDALSVAPLYLILDLQEEEFRLETIPRLKGRDREAVVARKLKRTFPDALCARSEVIGGGERGRSEDLVLLSAIPRQSSLEALFSRLEAQAVPLAGIYSLPLLLAPRACDRHAPGRCLLVTRMGAVASGAAARYRQTFIDRGHVLLSRVIGAALDDTAHFLDEMERGRRYLVNQKVLDEQDEIALRFLLAEADVERLLDTVPTGRHFRLAGEGLAEFSARQGVTEVENGTLESAVGALALARGWVPRTHYRMDDAMRLWRRKVGSRSLLMGGAAMLFGSVAFGGYSLWQTGTLLDRQIALTREIAMLDREYRKLDAGREHHPVEAVQLRDAVVTADAWQRRALRAESLFEPLSRVLARFPGIVVNRLSWGGPEAEAEHADLEADAWDAPVDAMAEPEENDAWMDPAPATSVAPVALILEGRVAQAGDSLQAELAYIRAFVAALRALPEVVEARVERLPIDLSPSGRVSGDVGERASGEQARGFSLSVELRRTVDAPPA